MRVGRVWLLLPFLLLAVTAARIDPPYFPLRGLGEAAAQTPGSREKIDSLLEMLKNGSPLNRRQAMIEMAEAGDFQTVPVIVKLLGDDDPLLRALTESALWTIWSRSGDMIADSLLRHGAGLLATGQPARSLAVFDDVISMAPNFAEGYNKRATAFYQLGRYQKSLADIEETLRRNPYHFGALSGAGLCMVGLERHSEALEYFQRALAINPNLTGILQLKKKLEKKAGRQAA
jgi:tetratricopeptide (TPR) repeat protein